MPPKTKWENGIIYIFATLQNAPLPMYTWAASLSCTWLLAMYRRTTRGGSLSNMMPLF